MFLLMKNLIEYAFNLFSVKLVMLGWIMAPVVSFIDQYIFNDWQFVITIAVMIGVDTCLGLLLAWKRQDISSEAFSKLFTKIIVYALLLVASHAAATYQVDGAPNTLLSWVDSIVYSIMVARELISIFEKTALLNIFTLPAPLLAKLRYFNDKGTMPKTEEDKIDNMMMGIAVLFCFTALFGCQKISYDECFRLYGRDTTVVTFEDTPVTFPGYRAEYLWDFHLADSARRHPPPKNGGLQIIDSLLLQEGRLRLSLKRYQHQLAIQGECLPETVIQKIPVSVKHTVFQPPPPSEKKQGFWERMGEFLKIALLCFVAGLVIMGFLKWGWRKIWG